MNTCYYTNIHCMYIHGEGFRRVTRYLVVALQYDYFAFGMLINWQHDNNDGICCDFLFETCTPLEQCTYLGWLLLEAPREYVQRGPLVSINWLWLCPQSGAHVRSHAVRRRLFIVLMTAAHISPNVFSLRNFLSNIHVLFLAYIHRYSYLLYTTFKQYLHPFITRQIILSCLRLLLAGRLLSVSRVWYSTHVFLLILF